MLATLVALLLRAGCVTTTTTSPSPTLPPPMINCTWDAESAASYSVVVDGQLWARSRSIWLRRSGREVLATDALPAPTLQQIGQTVATRGSDSLGAYIRRSRRFHTAAAAGDAPIELEFALRVYFGDAASCVFEQAWPSSMTSGIGNGNLTDISAGFPSLDADSLNDKGFLAWSGIQVGDYYDAIINRFPRGYEIHSHNNMTAAPLPVIFFERDRELPAVAMAPLNHPMHAVQFLQTNVTTDGGAVFAAGPGAGFSVLPSGYKFETLLTAEVGINRVWMRAGGHLLKYHNKSRTPTAGPPGMTPRPHLTKLGYTTADSIYQYNPCDGMPQSCKNFEDTMLAIHSANKRRGLPIGYYLIDSWWYGEHGVSGPHGQLSPGFGGIKLWEDSPDILNKTFPKGLSWLSNELDRPFVAHAGAWTTKSPYLGRGFVVNTEHGGQALPTQARFWEELLQKNSDGWRLSSIKQDHINENLGHVPAAFSNTSVTEDWLGSMGTGAAAANVSIVYCMVTPGVLLNSVKVGAAAAARCADDYHTNGDSWEMGHNSLMLWGVGLWPMHSSFMTGDSWADTTTTRYSGWNKSSSKHLAMTPERRGLTEALSAALAGGGVAAGDSVRLGAANGTILRSVCMADGTLLKPDRPAVSIDPVFRRAVGFDAVGPDGPVVATVATISGNSWYYIMVGPNVTAPFNLSSRDVETVFESAEDVQQITNGSHRVLHYDHLNLPSSRAATAVFGPRRGLTIPARTVNDSAMFYVVAPVIDGVLVFGEVGKLIPASRQRVMMIEHMMMQLRLTVAGTPGEVVQFAYYRLDTMQSATAECTISASTKLDKVETPQSGSVSGTRSGSCVLSIKTT